jgi:hypothetical protein
MAEAVTGIRQIPAGTPVTDGKLFDALHEWFGIGLYDEDLHGPWWSWRIKQVARIKSSRIKRDVALADLYVSALYCRAHGINIEGVTWLYRHLRAAWAWWDGATIVAATAPDALYAEAIRVESANQDDRWLTRLLRASPASREEVLKEWQQQHWNV